MWETNIHAQTQHANLYFSSPNGSKSELDIFKYCFKYINVKVPLQAQCGPEGG